MSPIFDFECQDCGKIHERLADSSLEACNCPECGSGTCVKIISASGQHCANDDAEWIRSVAFVADHSPDAPLHTREFVKNPTRKNYREWMRKEGLRHIEPGEKPRKRGEVDMDRIHREVMRRQMERRRVEI